MNRSIKLAGLVTGVSLAAVVAGTLVAAQQTPTLASASDGGVKPIDSVSKSVQPPSTTPSTPSTTPDGEIKQTIDLTKLKQGAAPTTSYVDGRTVHVGGTKFTLPASDGEVWDVARTGNGGALVLHRPNQNGNAVLTAWSGGTSGESIKDVSTVRSGDNLASSAYAVQPTNSEGTELPRFTLVWRDNPSGEKYSIERTGEHGPIVHAVQGSEVYFSALNKSEKQTLYKWIAGEDAPKPIAAVPTPSAVSSDLQLGASIVSTTDDGSCTALVEIASARKRWATCEYAIDELPAKSPYALGGPAYRDGYGDGLFAALDLRTGKAVREWSGGSKVAIISTTMEDADHVLVLAEQGDKTAIARCAPKTGTCELATPLKKGTGHTDSRPYQLGN
ncbi:hypothetical protein GCM10029976_006950 [Kribbella albertanoniae]|uniref:WD40 repeat domain-containing protein n=1 Tax=Kribbella albertanoniae TaxID=1266829 RepID=A0A4R4PB14_9ACTN|nr:hypothetical protein [Kribbella albertanoniae]TDC19124.1 hypothetical protein E1261_34545 [Kribbella albertanoniae]